MAPFSPAPVHELMSVTRGPGRMAAAVVVAIDRAPAEPSSTSVALHKLGLKLPGHRREYPGDHLDGGPLGIDVPRTPCNDSRGQTPPASRIVSAPTR